MIPMRVRIHFLNRQARNRAPSTSVPQPCERRRGRCGHSWVTSDGGSAAALFIVGALLVASVGQVSLILAQARLEQIRLQAIADLAALAAAEQVPDCERAHRLAAANGTTVTWCSVGVWGARVILQGSLHPSAPWLGRASARSHAGFEHVAGSEQWGSSPSAQAPGFPAPAAGMTGRLARVSGHAGAPM